MPSNAETETAVRRRQLRKIEHIVQKTYEAFHQEISAYGTLDAEEIMEIGINLLDAIMLKPLTRMSNDKQRMREVMIYQIAARLGIAPEEMGN